MERRWRWWDRRSIKECASEQAMARGGLETRRMNKQKEVMSKRDGRKLKEGRRMKRRTSASPVS
jgi:hypothetical protein